MLSNIGLDEEYNRSAIVYFEAENVEYNRVTVGPDISIIANAQRSSCENNPPFFPFGHPNRNSISSIFVAKRPKYLWPSGW